VVARGLGEAAHAVDLLSDACRLGERTGHPLLHGVACTVRGFALLDAGDPVSAEADAHASLAVVKPHDVVEAARVGPKVLLASARLAVGDAEAALAAIADVAGAGSAPSLLVPRRHALAVHASTLLAAGRTEDAVVAAQRAAELPAEDVRSRVVSSRVLAEALAAAGERDLARAAAARAVRTAYATQQAGERAAADAVLAGLTD
jgi:hypothetical protein